MEVFKAYETKQFMSELLKSDTFDTFEVKLVDIETFIKISLNCKINKTFFDLNEQENIKNDFALWKDIKPIVYKIIKGKKLPKNLKIVLSLPKDLVKEISSSSTTMFLNIIYENKEIVCITGISEKVFSLDKSSEQKWDNTIKTFFKKHNILMEEVKN